MKALKISLIAVFLIIFISGSLVSALSSSDASVRAIVSNSQPRQGDSIMVTLFFQNNSSEPVTLTNAGVHFDWMPTDGFYGFNLNNTPITVPAGDSYFFQNPVRLNVPRDASLGVHTYFAGVDGVQGAAQTPFSLDSAVAEIEVVASGETNGPTSNPSGAGPQGGSDLLIYGAIAIAVVVVALLAVVFVLRRKRGHAHKPAEPVENQPPPTKPEQKPSGQDFSI